MKRSKPSTVVGGGEMKRDTSSVESIARSTGASSARSSRSVSLVPISAGSAERQSVVVTGDGAAKSAAVIVTPDDVVIVTPDNVVSLIAPDDVVDVLARDVAPLGVAVPET